MKLFILEYITGGGLAGHTALPPSMLHEGDLMLAALLSDITAVTSISISKIILLRDARLPSPAFLRDSSTPDDRIHIIWISSVAEFETHYDQEIRRCDAFWPIAPESTGILEKMCRMAEMYHVPLINSGSAAVAICASKSRTLQILAATGLPVVSCFRHATPSPSAYPGIWVYKPDDGAGCDGVQRLADTASLDPAVQWIRQPWIEGRNLSISAIIHHQRAWLLSINQQIIEWDTRQKACLLGCKANTPLQPLSLYQQLMDTIALSIPGLAAYIGVDFILTPHHGPVLLEINPRMTTSYATLSADIGWNIGEAILASVMQHDWVPHTYTASSTG